MHATWLDEMKYDKNHTWTAEIDRILLDMTNDGDVEIFHDGLNLARIEQTPQRVDSSRYTRVSDMLIVDLSGYNNFIRLLNRVFIIPETSRMYWKPVNWLWNHACKAIGQADITMKPLAALLNTHAYKKVATEGIDHDLGFDSLLDVL